MMDEGAGKRDPGEAEAVCPDPQPASVARPVLGLLIIALLVTVLVAAWGAYDARLRAWDEASEQVKDVTHLLTEQASTLFSTHVASLHYVQTLAEDAGWTDLKHNQRFHDRLAEIYSSAPEIFGLWLLDARGNLVAASSQWPTPELNLADRDYFQAHVNGQHGVYIGRQAAGRLSGNSFLPISLRVEHPDGSFAGVVQVSLRPDYLIDFYRSLFGEEPKVMLLLRDDGTVLAREPAATGTAPDTGVFPQLLTAPADRDGLFTLVSPVDGVERLYARRKLPNLPVTVVYGMATAPILAEWRNTVLSGVAIAVPTLLAMVLLARMALRRSRDLRRAERGLRHANAVLEARVVDRTRHLNQALADREMLVRDTHHRVKNNLQVVSSLLHLQGALNPTVRPLLDDALHRIQAMGLLHEQLHQASKLDSVRLDLVLHTLLAEIDAIHQGAFSEERCSEGMGLEGTAKAGRPVVVDIDVSPVEMGVASAVPLILIVNEVVSNAYKHAFPDGRPGRVRVGLRQEGTEGMLIIEDDGAGMTPPAPEAGHGRRRSLGMTLVDAFTRQLGGAGGYQSAPRGTRFALRFPLAA